MTYLGQGDPFHRLEAAVRGALRRKPAGRQDTVAVVGHRGAPREEAENTLASFDLALRRGADAVEADVCVTGDGEFVLWHDADPDEKIAIARQLGVEGLLFRPDVPALGSPGRKPVREMSLEDFRRLHRYVPSAGDGGASRTPETLDDLLEWSGRSSTREAGLRHVFLDIKLAPDRPEVAVALAERVEEAARDGANPPVFHMLSPHAEVVAALVRSPAPSLRVSADFELPGAAKLGPPTGAAELSLGCGGRVRSGFLWDLHQAARARNAGAVAFVTAWTMSDPKRLAEVIEEGADAILTDDAARLRAMVGVSPPRPVRPFRPRSGPRETRGRSRAGRRGPC